MNEGEFVQSDVMWTAADQQRVNDRDEAQRQKDACRAVLDKLKNANINAKNKRNQSKKAKKNDIQNGAKKDKKAIDDDADKKCKEIRNKAKKDKKDIQDKAD